MQLFRQIIYKETIVNVANKINVKTVKIIHKYNTGLKKNSSINFFFKVVPKKFKKNKKKIFFKKNKILALALRTKQWVSRNDGSYRKFKNNDVILLNKKFNIISNFVIGPTLFEFYRKRYFFNIKNIF